MAGGQWEFIGSFVDFDAANALAMNRKDQVRLLKVVYDSGGPVNQEVIAELGLTRANP